MLLRYFSHVLHSSSSAATEFANAGATENQMMNKFNWKSSKMAQEYIASSGPVLKRNAEMLTPSTSAGGERSQPAKKQKLDAAKKLPEEQFPDDDDILLSDEEDGKVAADKDGKDAADKNGNESVNISMSGAQFTNCTVYVYQPPK